MDSLINIYLSLKTLERIYTKSKLTVYLKIQISSIKNCQKNVNLNKVSTNCFEFLDFLSFFFNEVPCGKPFALPTSCYLAKA